MSDVLQDAIDRIENENDNQASWDDTWSKLWNQTGGSNWHKYWNQSSAI